MNMTWNRYNKENKVHSSTIVNVIPIFWEDLKVGDMVYIGGDIKQHIPTCLYGRHKVVDIDKHTLINKRGQTFYENSMILFINKGVKSSLN